MTAASKRKILGTLFSAALVLLVVLIDPKGDIFGSFNKNYSKSYYFEQCEKKDPASTSTPLHVVVEVADGDTILVSRDCEPVTVRMIGINTPETVDPRRPVECFGKEASNRAKKMLTGKEVTIETDPSQDAYDKYGRLLGYVIMEDGTNFNLNMIEEGFAYEYTYKVPYKYQQQFKDAQKKAQEEQRGLWSSDSCNGEK